MKRDVSPSLIIVGVVITLIMLGGLYYRFMGAGSVAKESAVASPYGMPKPGEGFKTPPPGGSGINTITGEKLPDAVKAKENHTFMGGAPGPGVSTPAPPPGMKVTP